MVGASWHGEIAKGDPAIELWYERYLSFGRIADEIAYKRQQKYGPENIGTLGTKGLIPRIFDKVYRLKRAIWDNIESHDPEEKVFDAALDLRNYAQFLAMSIQGKWYNGADEKLTINEKLESYIAIDLDGTLAEVDELFYTRFHIGKPIKGAKESVDFFKTNGYKVFIFTARGVEEKDSVKKWLADNQIDVDEVICGKPPAKMYICDRSFGFRGDWGATMKEVSKEGDKIG